MNNKIKSLIVILLLLVAAIPALIVCLVATVRNLYFGKAPARPSGRTVLLTGGKMTKCLQLARMFRAAGDRVLVAETPLYQWCGTRFSNVIEQFFIIPKITGDGTSYGRALVEIAERKKVDVFVPVASPKAAIYDGIFKPNFPFYTEVFHFDEAVVKRLDDKHQFINQAKEYGLSVPESHNIDSREKMLNFNFPADKKYILKKIDYDPVYRLDLRTLPHPGWQERVNELPISVDEPWVLQEYIEGREICTHTTTCNGGMNLYICCDSSPFQVNYKMLDLPEVKKWVTTFVSKLNATGQISFDFMIRDNGEVIPIECNPRTHSAITLFHNQPEAGAAYYHPKENTAEFIPDKNSGHTFWLYHELHRISKAKSWKQILFLLNRIRTGKEAVFSWEDPWPFFFNNHIGIPSQIVWCLLRGAEWTRIDFNIGKLIVPGGD